MVRTLLLLALLMAGIVVAALLFLAPEEPPQHTGSLEPRPTDVQAPDDEAPHDEAPRSGAPRGAASGTGSAAPRIDVETPTGPAPADPAGPAPARETFLGGVNLRVVRAEDGGPLAATQVWFVSVEDQRDAVLPTDPVARQVAALRRLGTRCPDTDERGVTALPAGRDGTAYVAARSIQSDGSIRQGWKRIRTGASSSLRLELGRPDDLRVRVTRPDGSPAVGAPVCLSIPHGAEWRRVWLSPTGEDGSVSLDAVHARCHATHASSKPLREAAVGLGLLLAEPAFEPLDLTDLPETVDLVLPATGAVTVVVEALDAAQATVELRRQQPVVADDPMYLPAAVRTENGRVRFPQVGLGMELQVVAELANANEPTEVEALGPRAPEQEVEIRVSMFGDGPILRARLVDEENEPIAEASIHVVAKASRDGSSSQSSLTMETDADGVVLFAPGDDLGPTAERSMAFQVEGRNLHTACDVPNPLREGLHDLGTLTLRPPPLLLTGQVVKANGRPVEGARVSLSGKVVYDPERDDGFYWDGIDGAQAETDGEGLFTLSGPTDAQLLKAEVEAHGFVDQALEDLPVGVRDLKITMEQAGGVRGRILLPELGPRIRLELAVVSEDDGARTERPNFGGPFLFASVAPGAIAFEIVLFGTVEPLVLRRNLRVVGGEALDLGEIDLRDRVQSIGFTIVDHLGEPVSDAVALLDVQEPLRADRRQLDGVPVKNGRATVFAEQDGIGLFVYADGHRSAYVPRVTDGTEIVLQPAPVLEIQVDRETLPPAGRWELEVVLSQPDDTWPTDRTYMVRSESRSSAMSGQRPWDARLRTRVDAQGIARLELPAAGRYRARWRLRPVGPSARGMERVEDADEEFQVAEVGGPQRVRSRLTRASLEKAVPGGF